LEGLKKRLVQQGQIDKAEEVANEIKRVTFVLADVESKMPVEAQPAAEPAEVPRADLTASLREGLVLYYTFDKDKGDKVTDKSGKGNDGKVHGAKWTDRGKVGGAYGFHGPADFIDVGKPLLSTSGDWTVSLWVKADARQRTYLIEQYKSGHADRFCIYTDHGDNWSVCIDGTWPRITQVRMKYWTFLTVVRKGGEFILSSDGQAGEVVRRPNAQILKVSTKIGGGLGPSAHFDGFIDEVMIWDRALSAMQIEQLYKLQK
jgi:hypothetical protein